MLEKKVAIIGGGVAGLITGCYLQMNGYSTTIFEQHSIPGGLCTSWRRKGYTFDGCIHWLLGTGNGSVFYEIWNELLDMKDIKFINHDFRVAIELKDNVNKYGDKIFYLYSSVDKMKDYLVDLSPDDKKTIIEFIESIRFIKKYKLPPLVDKAPEVRTINDKLKLLKYIPVLIYMNKWGNVSNYDFAEKFKSPFLREAFELFFEGEKFTILAMIMQLAYFSSKSAGYPLNGSLSFAKKLENRYINLGGNIRYNTRIKKVDIKDDRAIGVITERDELIPADIVISAADWNFTIFNALDSKYIDDTIRALKRQETLKVFDSAIMISFGISKLFNDIPHLLRFPLSSPLEVPDGSKYERMEAHIYNYDPTMAEKLSTVISVTLTNKNPDYWIELRNSDYEKYKLQKEEIGKAVLDILENKFGGIKNNVEVMDVATPATFFRYTGNWNGSMQGWMPSKKLFAPSPVKKTLPGLKDFYMVGHWLEPGGGLPIALLTGRNTAQIICKKDSIDFKVIR
jgi:phytoene dehydrogenase-like protein